MKYLVDPNIVSKSCLIDSKAQADILVLFDQQSKTPKYQQIFTFVKQEPGIFVCVFAQVAPFTFSPTILMIRNQPEI